MKYLFTAFAILAASTAFAGDGAKVKKVKKVKAPVVQVAPAPVAAPAPAPAAAPATPAAPKPSFMEQQIAAALANSSRPVGVTTYGAMAAAVAAGQNGGTEEQAMAAAEAASAGLPAGQ
jgi:hypothetical protein